MKSRLLTRALPVAGAVLGLLAGCAPKSVNTVERAQPLGATPLVADRRIITDESLAKTVQVVDVAETTVSGNLRQVQVKLTNTRDKVRSFSYQFEWTDAQGMVLSGPKTGWKSRRIEGRETIALVDVAPAPQAVDFTLKLLEAR